MVGEALGPKADLLAFFGVGEGGETLLWTLPRSLSPGIRLVVHPADGIAHRHVPVLLEMREGTFRRVDWDVREVRAAEPFQLRVEVGEVAALQQRIV
jgi:hypothetical protein